MAKLLTRVDPDKYRNYMVEERGKEVIYVELQKALYGMLQAGLRFWENLTKFLMEELGFTVNPYDRCVVNTMIKGNNAPIFHMSMTSNPPMLGRVCWKTLQRS
jgi:hypothetical protein